MKEEILKKAEQTVGKDEAPEHALWERLRRLCDMELLRLAPATDTACTLEELYRKTALEAPQEAFIPTGFAALDDLTGGLRQGEFVVIGGRPSVGKTQLLINLSLNISHAHNVLYMSFDLSQWHLFNRFLATMADVELKKIQQNKLSKEENQAVKNAVKKFKDHKLYIDSKLFLSYELMELYLEQLIAEKDVKVLIIDYLQVLMFNNVRRYNRDAELDDICRHLRRLAAAKGICIVAASELNRTVECREGRRPQISDLRDSGGIEQHTDKILLLQRYDMRGIVEDEYGNDLTNCIEVQLAKNTSGACGSVSLKHNNKFTTILAPEALPDFDLQKRIEELGLDAAKKAKKQLLPF